MASLETRTDNGEVVSGPEFLGDEDSASIYPLLTPSPNEGKLMCPSPDFPADGQLLLAPGFMKDPESVSMCPLLESSPPGECFRHPLDPLGALSYTEANSELPGYVGLEQSRESRSSSVPEVMDKKHGKRGSVIDNLLESSSSSSSSAMQENPSCVKLLNHHYQQLNLTDKKDHGQFITQESGGVLEMSVGKIPSDHCFAHWNWPVIRTSCFWSMVSVTVACLCIVIGMIATVPRKCYPTHEWYQGTVFYEIFPASFQDGGYDGIGDLQGLAGRTSYFESLGISAIRLNSIFPAKDYPEEYELIDNLTSIDHRLGSFRQMEYLLATLHKHNISVILDLPIYPFVKSLGTYSKNIQTKSDKPPRKENISEKITNVVHNHRSHREANNDTENQGIPAMLLSNEKSEFSENKAMLNPYIDGGISGLMKVASEHLKSTYRTVVEDALHFWYSLGVDGIYIKGLEQYVYDPQFLNEIRSWHKIKMFYSTNRRKILMADHAVVNISEENDQKSEIFRTFDLLDVYLDLSNGTKQVVDQINKLVTDDMYKDINAPWFHWNIGNVKTPRLATRVTNNLGSILFQSLLPGTISIFYGDEMSLSNSLDTHGDYFDLKHHHQLIPMRWVNEVEQFALSSMVVPWLPYGEADSDSVTAKTIIRNLTNLRRTTPSIYMKSINKEGEMLLNIAMRYSDNAVVTIERYYPRRNTFVVLYNTVGKDAHKDVSKIYYGGEVIQTSNGDSQGYISFKNLILQAGEAIIVKLDK